MHGHEGGFFLAGNVINHMQMQLKFQYLYLYSFTFSKAGNVSGPDWSLCRVNFGLFDGRGLNPTGSHKDNCNIITVVWLGNICKQSLQIRMIHTLPKHVDRILFISGACERCNCIHTRAYFTCTLHYRVHLYLQHFPAVNNLKIL